MKKSARLLVALAVSCTFAGFTAAQDSSPAIPKVLQITREYTKPGKGGQAHDKAESAFVQAMAKAKWPTHYLALTSLSGKSRALFLTQYASFEAWEKDAAATEKNAVLSAELERAAVADGELVDSMDQGVFVFDQEASLRPKSDLSPMRFIEIGVFHIRPGHDREWDEGMKMVKAAYEKALPDAHWGVFNQIYGGEGDTHLIFIARKSLSEVDHSFEDQKKFAAAMGEDGMKKLSELTASAISSSAWQLFAFNPRMSYAPEEYIKADPDFWKPKAVTSMAKATTADKAKAVAEEKPKP